MFAHLCCWFHRIASYCAGVVSPTLLHFLRITFLISCNSFFCSFSFARHNFSLKFRIRAIYIYKYKSFVWWAEKSLCGKVLWKIRKTFHRNEPLEKKCFTCTYVFRGGKSKHVFNTNTLINNCHSGSMHTKTLSTNNNDCLSIWRWFA